MYKYKVLEVLRVVDGDTVDVILDLGFNIQIKERVRLVHINAPETRTLNAEEKKYGFRAKDKLEEYLSRNDEIIVATQKPDSNEKYGRVLGDIYVIDQNLTASEYLLANFYVWTYDTEYDLTLLNEEFS